MSNVYKSFIDWCNCIGVRSLFVMKPCVERRLLNISVNTKSGTARRLAFIIPRPPHLGLRCVMSVAYVGSVSDRCSSV